MKDRIYNAFENIKAEEQLKEDTLKSILEKADKRSYTFGRKSIFAVCASLFLLLFVSGFSYNLYFTDSAYIDIDVNPSIELTINRFNYVIDAHAYNEDGNKILKAIDLKYKSYDKAVAVLIGKMEEEGYLQDDGLVSATLRTDWAAEGRLRNLEQTVADTIQKIRSNCRQEIYTVDSVTKESAHEEDVSPAKYLAILKLQEVAPSTTMEECKNHSISEIREEIHSHVSSGSDHNKSHSSHEGNNSQSEEDNDSAVKNERNGHQNAEGQSEGNGHQNEEGQNEGNGHQNEAAGNGEYSQGANHSSHSKGQREHE